MKKFYPILLTLKIGDRLVVPKSTLNLVQHHAIYLGFQNGRFWVIENKDGIGVRVVDSDVFFADVNIITRVERFTPRSGYSRNDLAIYALSKKGKSYSLLHYNCETFCNDIQHHVPKSGQAETGLAISAFAGIAILLIALAAQSN